MKKILVLCPNESWVIDCMGEEWYEHNADISTKNLYEADIIWFMADWCFDQLPYDLLQKKKVVTTIFHIVPEKFDAKAKEIFMKRDAITDLYNASCDKTAEYLREIGVKKPIQTELFWIDGNKWRDLTTDEERTNSHPVAAHYVRRQRLKKEMGLDSKDFLLGTFQRDSEGKNVNLPKKEKGPQNFADFVALAKIRLAESAMNPVVLLGGWRRHYLRNRLDEIGVKYIDRSGDHGQQMPSSEELNRMYNSLDLYVVGSLYEGLPYSVLESAITKTPIISTDVGVASAILSPQSIAKEKNGESLMEAIPDVEYAYKKVQKYKIPQGFEPFRKMLSGLCQER